MTESYPRVLIINGDPFQQHVAGRLLSGLFRGWPVESIATVFTADIQPDTSLCQRYWRLSVHDMAGLRWARPGVARRQFAGTETAHGIASPSSTLPGGARGRAVAMVRGILEQLPYRVSPELHAWIQDFRPEVVYSMLGSYRIVRLVLDVSEHYHLPLVPHFMDDWPSTRYAGSFIHALPRRRLINALMQVFDMSTVRMTISEAMAEEYIGRYGGDFRPFANNPDIAIDRSSERNASTGPFIMCYVGNLGHGRSELLADVARAADQLIDAQRPVEIQVRTSGLPDELRRELSGFRSVRLLEDPTDEDMKTIRREVDCFLHLDSFEPSEVKFFRLSFSSKLPIYMSAGLPILAYGPKSVGSIQMIERVGCGLVVDSRGQTQLKSAISRLVNDYSLRQESGLRGQAYRDKHLNPTATRNAFREALAQAARQDESSLVSL